MFLINSEIFIKLSVLSIEAQPYKDSKTVKQLNKIFLTG